jgi:hypothetical protein
MKKSIVLLPFATLFLALFGFLYMGVWEFVQSPFFVDISEDFRDIVLFRIHCTLGDVLILFEIATVLSLIRWSWNWILQPKLGDYLLFTLMGMLYTAFSEYMNVYVRGSWGYSDLMPVIPLTGVGVVPLVQWLVLPSLILTTTSHQLKGYFRQAATF